MKGGAGPFEPVTVNVGLKEKENEFLYLMKAGETVRAEISRKSMFTAPVKKGENVGTLTYYLNEEPVKIYDLVTTEAVEKKNLNYIVQNIFYIYLDFSTVICMK